MTARRLDRALRALAVVLAAVAVYQAVYRATWSPNHRTDYTVYTAAARAALDGGDLYAARNRRGWLFNAAPAFAVAMIPFDALGVAAGSALFAALSVAALVGALVGSARAARAAASGPSPSVSVLAAAGGLLVLYAALSGASRGNPSIVGLSLGALAAVSAARGRDGRAGLMLAAATAIKVFPAALAIGWLVAGRRRAVVAFVAWSLAFAASTVVALGPAGAVEAHRRFVAVMLDAAATPRADAARFEQTFDPGLIRNQSASAIGARIGGAFGAPAEGSAAGFVLAAGLWVFAVMRGRRLWTSGAPDGPLRGATATLLPVLLLAPTAWSHYFVLLAPAGVLLARDALAPRPAAPRSSRFGGAVVLATQIAVAVAPPLRGFGVAVFGWLAAWPALFGRQAVAAARR